MNYDKLMVGFVKLSTGIREEWISDIKMKYFGLQLFKVGTETTIGNPVFLEPQEVDVALVTKPKEMVAGFLNLGEKERETEPSLHSDLQVSSQSQGNISTVTEKNNTKNKRKKHRSTSEDDTDDEGDSDVSGRVVDYSKDMDGDSSCDGSSDDDDN